MYSAWISTGHPLYSKNIKTVGVSVARSEHNVSEFDRPNLTPRIDLFYDICLAGAVARLPCLETRQSTMSESQLSAMTVGVLSQMERPIDCASADDVADVSSHRYSDVGNIWNGTASLYLPFSVE